MYLSTLPTILTRSLSGSIILPCQKEARSLSFESFSLFVVNFRINDKNTFAKVYVFLITTRILVFLQISPTPPPSTVSPPTPPPTHTPKKQSKTENVSSCICKILKKNDIYRLSSSHIFKTNCFVWPPTQRKFSAFLLYSNSMNSNCLFIITKFLIQYTTVGSLYSYQFLFVLCICWIGNQKMLLHCMGRFIILVYPYMCCLLSSPFAVSET